MVNVHASEFTDRWGTEGEIRIGWASWDEDHEAGSVKWAYHDATGKISRGAPEVPIDVLTAMVEMVLKYESFFPQEDRDAISKLKKTLNKKES